MKSFLLLVATAALAVVTTAPASAQTASGTMPELTGATWFNTPPLTNEDLGDRAILFEVFRTW
jgi:hypothetical protein